MAGAVPGQNLRTIVDTQLWSPKWSDSAFQTFLSLSIIRMHARPTYGVELEGEAQLTGRRDPGPGRCLHPGGGTRLQFLSAGLREALS